VLKKENQEKNETWNWVRWLSGRGAGTECDVPAETYTRREVTEMRKNKTSSGVTLKSATLGDNARTIPKVTEKEKIGGRSKSTWA